MSDCENLSSSELWNRGRKLYILQDYSKALEYLSKACKLISSEKGDTCDELFEPYLIYSKCLYMYTKTSNDNIGDEVNDSVVDEAKPMLEVITEEDKSVVIEGKEEEGVIEGVKGGVEKQNTDDEEEKADVDEEKDVIEEEVKIDGTDVEILPESEEDVGYLEMAYETVECAKLIIKRQREDKVISDKELDLRLADCCDIAGDIYIEEEVMKEAIEQYETALKFRQAHLAPSDRSISESHYKMAVAFNINYELRAAREQFIKCREVLLMHRAEENGGAEDLTEVIAEIDARIDEAREGEAEFERAKESMRAFLAVGPSVAGGVADDISHLVKRTAKKRTTNPEEEEQDGPSSKAGRTSQ